MLSMNHFIKLAIVAATLLISFACGQSSSPVLKVKVASFKELGLDINFEYVAITTQEQAKEHRHLGSPTIQINGLDIEPAARNADQFGIA